METYSNDSPATYAPKTKYFRWTNNMRIPRPTLYHLILLLISLNIACTSPTKDITVFAPSDGPQLEFALTELETVLKTKGITVKRSEHSDATILFHLKKDKRLKSEGFEITKTEGKISVSALDVEGLMYGGLELAEQIKIGGIKGVENTLQNPYMEKRGSKFNIPLDVRTPSYTDASATAQHNLPVMWEMDFWEAYIDNLARHRYNYISLWNLHPFPSMVKVPGFEDIALDDVHKSTIDWKENYHLHATDITSPEILENYKVVKKITIEEKIGFWKKVMRYAKDRNIDFYVITWNIFTNGTNGKYGITDRFDNEVTKEYFRKSIKQLFVSYPDLQGIGLTTGENMHNMNFDQKEQWAYDTYAQAILETAEEMPERNFTFIHRQHQTGAKAIAEKFKPVIDAPNIEFIYSFKYAKAHVLSTTEQHYHQGFVEANHPPKKRWIVYESLGFIDVPGGSKIGKLF
ncbi:glycoside hydrolase family 20 zincin-like fold domain-containing protein [Maribacter sp. 2307ULW6-5]|uniref:glycoside hydrolase family 20 zincin-like fold domain-containing protein n=1 Tax=Maribacter sp. 2307ULW6-5 TaxID=3386275 RepID=UPI0039BD4501